MMISPDARREEEEVNPRTLYIGYPDNAATILSKLVEIVVDEEV